MQSNKINTQEIHKLTELSIRNYPNSVINPRVYQKEAYRQARILLKENGKQSDLYYEIAHLFAQKALSKNFILYRLYYALRVLHYVHKSLKYNINNSLSWYLRAAVFQHLGKKYTAKKYYLRSWNLNNNNLSAAKSLINMYIDERDYEQALVLIDKSLSIKTDTQLERRRQIEIAVIYMRLKESVYFEVGREGND